MASGDRGERLEAARTRAELSVRELWERYVGVGGSLPPSDIRAFLGGRAISNFEWDRLAAAINDRFIERGQDSPVPYAEELR